MSLQALILQRLEQVSTLLNSIVNNSKTNEELPVQTNLDLTSVLRVSRESTSETITLNQIVAAAQNYEALVENEYSNLAALLADQDNQTNGYVQFVDDARSDAEITAGDDVYFSYYEYLGTTNLIVSLDYREISQQEIDAIQNSYQSFNVKQLSETIDDNCFLGQILIQKNNSDVVTALLFDVNYSKFLLRNKADLTNGDPVYLRLDNKTSKSRAIFKVENIEFSNASNTQYLVSVSVTESSNLFNVNDTVNVHVWSGSKSSTSGLVDLSNIVVDKVETSTIDTMDPDKIAFQLNQNDATKVDFIYLGSNINTAVYGFSFNAVNGTLGLKIKNIAQVRSAIFNISSLENGDSGIGTVLTCGDYNTQSITLTVGSVLDLTFNYTNLPPQTYQSVKSAVDWSNPLPSNNTGDRYLVLTSGVKHASWIYGPSMTDNNIYIITTSANPTFPYNTVPISFCKAGQRVWVEDEAVFYIFKNTGSVNEWVVDSAVGVSTALTTTYDNSNSSLVGTNVKTALDELDSKKVNLTGDDDDIVLGNGGTTSLSALDPNATPVPAGQIYANNFETLIGLNLEQTTGTVNLQTPIGTTVPNVPNALTVDYVAVGNAYASIDLGQTYDELYIQYYVCVPNPSTATSYTDNLKVGSSVNGGTITQVSMNHATNDFRAYGVPGYDFIGTRYMKAGVWYKIGLHIDRVAQTCDFYLDGRFSGQKATNNADMQFITLGGSGDNVSGYKIQYASLTVNETEFQNTIVNENGVGQYKTHYVDYSLKDSGLDMTGWSGMFSEPFDPDGGTNYIDGPALYLSDISGTNAYAKKYDFYKIKRGTVLKMKDLNTPHQLSLGATGYSDETHLTLDAYGSGDLPFIDTSIVADDTAWTLHDATNFIYKQTIANINRLYGVWIDEDKGLNITTTYADLETTSGQAYTDNVDLFIRLYDDGDPSVHVIDVASNQNNLIRPYCIAQNIHLRFGLTIHEGEGFVRNCEGTKGLTVQVSNNAVAYDNHIHDQWGGKDYVINSEGSSGAYGFIAGNNGKVIRNKVYDCYVNIETSHSNVGVDILYNDVRNAVVSNIECGGNVGGGSTVANPINISNNTVFHAPKTTQNIYPISGDQPGHGIVVQSGTTGSAYYRILNNIILTHFNENLGQNGTPNCIALENASWGGEVDYNRYFISDASDSLPKYYGTGDDAAVWVSTLEANGWTGYNGVGKPEAHSKIDLLMSVISGEALATGDEWLNVIPQPAYLGGAYPINIDALETLEINKNLSEEELTIYRNIGAY